MRIGIDGRTFFQRTGVGRTTRHLLCRLAASDSDNEYVVFISNHHRAADYPYPTNNTQVIVSVANWMSGPEEIDQLAKEAAEHRLDLMYFLFQLPREFPTPFAIKVYDVIPLLFPQWHIDSVVTMFRKQLAASCQAAAAIITPSNSTARDVMAVASLDSAKLHVVNEAVAGVRDKPGAAGGDFALFVGTLEPRKNVPFLIRLWQRYASQLNGLRLVIAGKEGWDVEACELVKSGVPGVEYRGYVSDEELAGLYENACCLVYPSFYEGFGLPVLEAMAAGCPVITTANGSLGEVAENAAIILDTYQEERWIETLRWLADNATVRHRLSLHGLKRAREFTVQRHVSETLQVLRQVCVEACA